MGPADVKTRRRFFDAFRMFYTANYKTLLPDTLAAELAKIRAYSANHLFHNMH